MCTVSNVIDNWRRDHDWGKYDPLFPKTYPSIPASVPSRKEFDDLKKELEALKKLIRAAKEFDRETGQPDCEMDDKVKFLRKMADYLGVSLEDIFD